MDTSVAPLSCCLFLRIPRIAVLRQLELIKYTSEFSKLPLVQLREEVAQDRDN